MRLDRGLLPLGLAAALLLGACGAARAPLPLGVAAGSLAAQAKAGSWTPATGTITGDVRVLHGLASKFLKQPRDIWIYLPPGYAQAKDRYPVLYMHDGNNVFDAKSAFGGNEWQADESAERLIKAGQLPPMVIVGVGNTADRTSEYTWVAGMAGGTQQGGNGAAYAQFLVQELKPLIDRTYRTLPDRDHTGVLGSSLGGLESFYLGRYDADTFSKIGVMSPSIWWSNKAVLKEVPALSTHLKIWLDIGGQEGDTPQDELDNAREMDRDLLTDGYQQGQNLDYYEDPQGGHNELAWAYRLPLALQFLFGNVVSSTKP